MPSFPAGEFSDHDSPPLSCAAPPVLEGEGGEFRPPIIAGPKWGIHSSGAFLERADRSLPIDACDAPRSNQPSSGLDLAGQSLHDCQLRVSSAGFPGCASAVPPRPDGDLLYARPPQLVPFRLRLESRNEGAKYQSPRVLGDAHELRRIAPPHRPAKLFERARPIVARMYSLLDSADPGAELARHPRIIALFVA